MLINNHLKLFFNSTVTEDKRLKILSSRLLRQARWVHIQHLSGTDRIVYGFKYLLSGPPNSRFSWGYHLEKCGDSCLKEWRYWWKGKKIELHDEYVLVTEEKRPFASVIDKIKSVAVALLLFIPGILLKGLAWLEHPFDIYRRNELIGQHLKKREDFIQKSNQQHKVQPKAFKEPEKEQNQSLLLALPKDMKTLLLSYLDKQARGRFARTCKKNYQVTADFYRNVLYALNMYPAVITESLGKNAFLKLPHGILPASLHILFEYAKRCHQCLIKPLNAYEASLLVSLLLSKAVGSRDFVEDLFDSMGNDAIQTIQTAEGPGLVIRLKNNLPESFGNKAKQALIIAKIQGQWMVLGLNTSGAMWLFSNDMHFSDYLPELTNYFKRLFKGEPCGNFSDALNSNIQIDYKLARAGQYVQEGPRMCPDGKTPVIQLWPAD